MGKLTDILAAGGQSGDEFRNAWDSTSAAGDFGPLPAGWYECRVESGMLDASKKGTPGYKLVFAVLSGHRGEGDFAGRKLWHDLWLTPAALAMSKRDLAKLGIVDLAHLETPLPPGIRCRVRVLVHSDDSGVARNHVKQFDVIGVDTAKPDPFAAEDEDSADTTPDSDNDDEPPSPTPNPTSGPPKGGGDAAVAPKQQDLNMKGVSNVPF